MCVETWQRSSRVRCEVLKKLLVDLYQKHDVMWKVDRHNYKKRGLPAKAVKSLI